MTKKEHRLMVFMFARQNMLISALIEILRSRGVMHDGDVEAYEALIRSEEGENLEHFHAVVNQYQAYGQLLGIEDLLPPSKKS